MTGPARPRPTRGASSLELAGAPAPVLFPAEHGAPIALFPGEGYRMQNIEADG
jgi:hypothetical protein